MELASLEAVVKLVAFPRFFGVVIFSSSFGNGESPVSISMDPKIDAIMCLTNSWVKDWESLLKRTNSKVRLSFLMNF